MENFGPKVQIVRSPACPCWGSTPRQATQQTQKSLWPCCSLAGGSVGEEEHSQCDSVASCAPHTVTSSQAARGLANVGYAWCAHQMVFKEILQGPKPGSKWQGRKRAQIISGLILGLLDAIKGS